MVDTFTMEGTRTAGYVDNLLPAAAVAMSRGALGSREQVEAEVDAILDAVRDFWRQEPDQVMRACAAYSARATELEVHLHRVETRDRTFRQVRTLQVQPLLAELDRQFKLASRLVELRRQDLEVLRG